MANNMIMVDDSMVNKEWPNVDDLITCADFEFGRKGCSKGAIGALQIVGRK